MSSSTSTRVAVAAASALALVACSDDRPSRSITTSGVTTGAPAVSDAPVTSDERTPDSFADATTSPSSTSSAQTSWSADLVDADALQAVLDAAHAALPDAQATVQAAIWSRSRDIDWASGGGLDPDAADRPFRMASVGKTVTAATVLQLSAQGELALDSPIRPMLASDTAALLEGDGYDLDAITVRHLLTHTGGLYDYAFGEGSPFLQQALADRGRRWTRREQVELAVTMGGPLWPAGGGFAYSDTGYVLLGEIVEDVTGVPYFEAAREALRFADLGLDHLWLEAFEPAPADLPAMSRSFLASDEISDLDFSLDGFGGGGYAGTPRDVARFFGLLFAGDLIAPEALDELRSVPDTNVGQEEFGVLLGDGAHGVYRMQIDGRICWSHRGFLGTIALACPDDDLSVVVTTNTALTDPLPVAASLLAIAAG